MFTQLYKKLFFAAAFSLISLCLDAAVFNITDQLSPNLAFFATVQYPCKVSPGQQFQLIFTMRNGSAALITAGSVNLTFNVNATLINAVAQAGTTFTQSPQGGAWALSAPLPAGATRQLTINYETAGAPGSDFEFFVFITTPGVNGNSAEYQFVVPIEINPDCGTPSNFVTLRAIVENPGDGNVFGSVTFPKTALFGVPFEINYLIENQRPVNSTQVLVNVAPVFPNAEDQSGPVRVINIDSTPGSQFLPAISVTPPNNASSGFWQVTVPSGGTAFFNETVVADIGAPNPIQFNAKVLANPSVNIGPILITLQEAATPVANPIEFDVCQSERTFVFVRDFITINGQPLPPGTPFTINLVTQPTKGTVVIFDNGTANSRLLYTAFAGSVGTDPFIYNVVVDGTQSNNSGITPTIIIQPRAAVNQQTTFIADAVVPLQINYSSIFSLAGSPTFSIVSGPFHGTVSENPTNFVYFPDPGFSGTDNLVVQATISGTQGTQCTLQVPISIIVRQCPELQPGVTLPLPFIITQIGAPVAIDLNTIFTPFPNQTFMVVQQPLAGFVTPQTSTGIMVYTPTTTISRTDRFTVRASIITDGVECSSDEVPIRIAIEPNCPIIDA